MKPLQENIINELHLPEIETIQEVYTKKIKSDCEPESWILDI